MKVTENITFINEIKLEFVKQKNIMYDLFKDTRYLNTSLVQSIIDEIISTVKRKQIEERDIPHLT